MTKRELQRLSDLLMTFYEDGSPDELRHDVSTVRWAVIAVLEELK